MDAGFAEDIACRLFKRLPSSNNPTALIACKTALPVNFYFHDEAISAITTTCKNRTKPSLFLSLPPGKQ